LFQAMRYEDAEVREKIRNAPSPMKAKMIGRKREFVGSRVVEAMSEADLANMRLCVSIKLAQNELLGRQLRWTHDARIIEDCSSRARGSGLFWGARRVEGGWCGENWLGRIWMELRSELKM